MSPEIRMLERVLEAVGRLSAAAETSRSALQAQSRVLTIAQRAIRSEVAMAEFSAAAASRRRGVRWIISGPQRATMNRFDGLRLKAAAALETMIGPRPSSETLATLARAAAAQGAPDIRADLEEVLSAGVLRPGRQSSVTMLPMMALLAMLAHLLNHGWGNGNSNGSQAA